MPHQLAQIAPLHNPAVNRVVGNVMYRQPLAIFQVFLRNLIAIAIGFAGVYMFYTFIRGGYEFMSAGGDKEAVQKAQKRIINGTVGMIVVLSIYAITRLVEYVFGISILNFNIPRP